MGKGDIIAEYNKYYSKKDVVHIYPVEFVVRTFLGTYPNLKMDRTKYTESKILDIGYGDGRNMPLLNNLGFKIYGVEISDEINTQAAERLKLLGIDAELKTGSNNSIPYGKNIFDYILACHACYYINEGTTFTDNINEITRVLKPGGIFICSVPMSDTYILKDAEKINPESDINELHSKTFELMKKHRAIYYKGSGT